MGFNLHLTEQRPEARRAPPWRRTIHAILLVLIWSGVAVVGDLMLAGGRYSSLLIADAGATLQQTGVALRGLLKH